MNNNEIKTLINNILSKIKTDYENWIDKNKFNIIFSKPNIDITPDFSLLEKKIEELISEKENNKLFFDFFEQISSLVENNYSLDVILEKIIEHKNINTIFSLIISNENGKLKVLKSLKLNKNEQEKVKLLISEFKNSNKSFDKKIYENYLLYKIKIKLKENIFLFIGFEKDNNNNKYLDLIDLIFNKIFLKTFTSTFISSEDQTTSIIKPNISEKEKLIEISKEEKNIKKLKYNHLLEPVNLPAMPHVAQQLLQIVGKKNTTAQDIQNLVITDQTLSAKLLSVSNSPLYGLNRKITTISDAVVILGFNAVRSIAIANCTRSWYNRVDKNSLFNADILWQHSISTAVAAKFIAQEIKEYDVEELYLIGLLHDIGKLIILLSEKDIFQEITNKYITNNSLEFTELEDYYLGMNHCFIGSSAAKFWNFSEYFVNIISNHHNYHLDNIPNKNETEIIAFANILSKNLGFSFRKNENIDISYFINKYNLSKNKIEEIKEKTLKVISGGKF